MTLRLATASALAAAALLAPLSTAHAAPTTTPPTPDRSVEEITAQWLAHEYRLSPETARQRVAQQPALTRKAEAIESRLGADRSAGSYIDQRNGTLVVTVTDAAAARTAREAGAQVKKVARDESDLTRLQNLTAARLGSLAQSVRVDVRTNSVIAEVGTPQATAAKAKVTDLKGVTIEATSGTTTSQANIYGGQEIGTPTGSICSLAFPVTRAGTPGFITAGHCAGGRGNFTRNGQVLGRTQAFAFPGPDMAWASMAEGWTGVGAVDRYNGRAVAVSGSSDAAVGTAICKSGRTTGWTCGQVEAKNVDVLYSREDGGTDQMRGLTRTNVCTEPGDSGGAWLAGTLAQGVTSGGLGYTRERLCGEKVQQPNVSYFQPITPILSRYGLTLTTYQRR